MLFATLDPWREATGDAVPLASRCYCFIGISGFPYLPMSTWLTQPPWFLNGCAVLLMRDRHPSFVHWSLSVGQKFVPPQAPPRHASRSVHAFASLQAVPSGAAGFEHAPVAVSGIPAT